MCTTCHHDLNNLLSQHIGKLDRFMEQQRREVVRVVDERFFTSNNTQITLLPQSQNLEIITALFAYCGAATGGTLLLGADRSFTLPQGWTIWTNVGFRLYGNDLRQLTMTTSSVMALELHGYEVPDKGPY